LEEFSVAKLTIDKVGVRGKRVLMRVDFNVPVEGGAITDDRRIEMAIPSIREVIDRGGSCVLMSHRGRPKGAGYDDGASLKVCAERLSQLLGVPVAFPSTDCIDAASGAAVDGMQDGQVLLLENLRFHKEETEGDPDFAEKLASFGDIYCNDAFGAAHREHASIVSVAKIMREQGKPCVSGLLMAREIRYLSDAIANPGRPFVAVLGGAKVSDKIPAIERLLEITDTVLIGGAMAYTLLAALGRRVGSSRVEQDSIPAAKRILDKAAVAKCDLILPTDHVAATQFESNAEEVKVFEGEIPEGWMGMDIGPATQATYAGIIEKAKLVVWNGPMGVFEWRKFSMGTQTIADAMVAATKNNGAVTIVGGGDSAAAVEKFGAAGVVSHVSTGGGASLELLEGRAFDSIAALDDA
jgi:phosphoglycerate kinase